VDEDKKTGEGAGAAPSFDVDFTKTLQQFGQLSAATVEMWSAWGKTWASLLQERGGPALEASLRRMTDPAAWTGGDTKGMAEDLEQVFALPRLADVLAVDVQAFRVLEPSVELLRIGRDHTLVAGQVWTEACRRFQARLEEARKARRRFDGPGEVVDIWNNIVDDTLIEFNRSEHFADLQRRFVRAMMRYRLEQRRLAEKVCEVYDLPTRSEIDELHRKVHELQREVRRLRRAGPKAEAPKERSQRPRPRSATG
jgi:polyhydroxyalkanoate synthase subunit PhaE